MPALGGRYTVAVVAGRCTAAVAAGRRLAEALLDMAAEVGQRMHTAVARTAAVAAEAAARSPT